MAVRRGDAGGAARGLRQPAPLRRLGGPLVEAPHLPAEVTVVVRGSRPAAADAAATAVPPALLRPADKPGGQQQQRGGVLPLLRLLLS